MVDFTDHSTVVLKLEEAQDADRENRERAHEAAEFVDVRDGQWEPDIITTFDGKPRYTFDQVSPIIDQIAGAIEQSSFDIKVKPAGGEATKELAQTRDGLIRNIQVMSNADDIFNAAARGMVKAGFDAWLIAHDFVDDDSFNQDLILEPIHNAIDSVWFDPNARKQDKSDSRYAFILQALTKDAYDKEHPDGKGVSVGRNTTPRRSTATTTDDIIIGQIYFIREEMRTLHELQNGAILNDEQLKQLNDRLRKANLPKVETRSRKRKRKIVHTRLFDGSDWLNEEQETVFAWIPVIPVYGNYSNLDNHDVYRGVVEKLMDTQRVFNYAQSRKIEEGALAPRAKWWMTAKQILGFESTIQTLNTNPDPVQQYNADPAAPGPPQQSGGAIINAGLSELTGGMSELFGRAAGMFAASMGDNPGLQSGVAIKTLQNKGDIGTIKFFKSVEIAICHTGRILNDSLNRVYDTQRQQRILGEDGTFKIEDLNSPVFDMDKRERVIVNDLSQGKYDVTCVAGMSFDNKMEESVAAFTEIAQVFPQIMQIGGDVFMKNMTAPGMEVVSERLRDEMFKAGLIPRSQWTEEEQQQALEAQQAAAQQQPQQDPAMLIGLAEMKKATNEETKIQGVFAKTQSDIQTAASRERREDAKLQLTARNDQVAATQSQEALDMKAFSMAMQQQIEDQRLLMDQNMQLFDIIKSQAEAWAAIQKATPEAVTGPGNVNALIGQAEDVVHAQRRVGTTPTVQI